jgi:hypothetical protein
MTESSKAYIITQYGLSCFEATGPGAYQARTFNFYLFPQPHGGYNRRFLCDASSLVFLASHGVCSWGRGHAHDADLCCAALATACCLPWCMADVCNLPLYAVLQLQLEVEHMVAAAA